MFLLKFRKYYMWYSKLKQWHLKRGEKSYLYFCSTIGTPSQHKQKILRWSPQKFAKHRFACSIYNIGAGKDGQQQFAVKCGQQQDTLDERINTHDDLLFSPGVNKRYYDEAHKNLPSTDLLVQSNIGASKDGQ